MAQSAHSGIGKYDVYNERMTGAMMDKLFFVDKVPADLLVDFGCADGTLVRHLCQWYKDARFVGYDTDATMVEAAGKNLVEHAERVALTDKWPAVRQAVEQARLGGRATALVLSSIIHEVYHYSDAREIDAFWTRVFESGFDFIVVRDMVPSRGVDRLADINDVAKVYRRFLHQRTPRFRDPLGQRREQQEPPPLVAEIPVHQPQLGARGQGKLHPPLPRRPPGHGPQGVRRHLPRALRPPVAAPGGAAGPGH